MDKTYEQLYNEQVNIEIDTVNVSEDRMNRSIAKAIEGGRFDETQVGQTLMKMTFDTLSEKCQEYLDTEYQGHTGKTQRYLAYLFDSDAKVMAYIVLQGIIKRLAIRNNHSKLTTIALYLIKRAKIVNKERLAFKSNPKLLAYLGSEYRRASVQRKQYLIEKHLESIEDPSEDSVDAQELRAGAMLVELLLKSGLNLIQKDRIYDRRLSKFPTYFIRFTDETLKIIPELYNLQEVPAVFKPMIIPPQDWVGFEEGGYITQQIHFIKTKSRKERKELANADISKPMGVINKLQKTGWRINRGVYDVVKYIYANNLVDPTSPKELPTLYGGIPTNTPTLVGDVLEPIGYNKDPTPEEKKEWAIWNRKRENIQIGLDGENGRRLQYLYTIAMADSMIKYKEFFYVYQLDYRGRVYPHTDFLTPQSKGYVKALLEFSDGEYLDDEGWRWLKIHLANTAGYDKIPFEARVQWVDDNLQQVIQAAEDPLGSLGSWVHTDSPFEFLGACMAYIDALAGKKVHIPIQLDAVNSGIQMYSGLLRDKQGALSTCVIGNVRSDLYQEVADKVEEKLLKGDYPPYICYTDKAGEEKIKHTAVEAKSMIGNFTRKMTKYNVMTVPYSVSMRGMSDQNWTVMDDMTLNGKSFWEGDPWIVNKLWTMLTHESIYEIVQGARAGQEYLKDVARGLETPALWHTPIYNLPVLQHVPKSSIRRVKTILGTLQLNKYDFTQIKRQKQLSSIAANFIHSIDATILLGVVERMDNRNIGTIHDCMLVHPNHGEIVRDAYKDAYVVTMKLDPLAMFGKELDPEGKIKIPYVGDLNLEEVYGSEYIIS